ncbi:DUF1998 domain-containing protein [Lachnospiraceae bacterium JLR.KK008]
MLNAISSQIGIHEWGFAGSTWRQFDFGISSEKLKISNSLSKDIDGKEMYQSYKNGEFVQIYFPSDRKFEISKSRTVETVDISAVKKPTEKMNYIFGQLLIYLYFEKLIKRPYHSKFARNGCRHVNVENVNLGYDFITDMLVMEFALDSTRIDTRRNDNPWLNRAALSLAEAIRLAASKALNIEFMELVTGYRLRENAKGFFVDIYLYDSLSSGAGYADSVSEEIEWLLDEVKYFCKAVIAAVPVINV